MRWIEQVLRRFEYRRLGRADNGAVLAYLQHLSGYSRAQLTRLVSRWAGGKPLVKNYRRPEHAFARRYTAADVALLADVDRAMGTLSGPGHGLRAAPPARCVRDARFERLGDISVGHLYNLRNSAPLPGAARGADQDTADAARGYRRAQGSGARGPTGLHPHRQRPPGRPRRHQGPVPHQRGGLRHAVAGGGHACRPSPRRTCCPSSSRCSSSSPSRSWASTPTTAASTSTTAWPRCWTSCKASSSRAAGRVTATTTAWPRPRTARWCARSSATTHIPQRHAARFNTYCPSTSTRS